MAPIWELPLGPTWVPKLGGSLDHANHILYALKGEFEVKYEAESYANFTLFDYETGSGTEI